MCIGTQIIANQMNSGWTGRWTKFNFMRSADTLTELEVHMKITLADSVLKVCKFGCITRTLNHGD